MVAVIPVRFKRVAEAFEEVAKVRGSGSKHFPAVAMEGDDSLRDLSDLVNSFLEKGNYGNFKGDEDDNDLDHEELDSEWKDLVEKLLGFVNDDDEFRRAICFEVEEGMKIVGDSSSSPEFKRRLITWLRERGFDAGLCKTKWERNGRLPSGHYEYIDINSSETRYIIEISLVAEFNIARPTNHYMSLLENIPQIFVCKVDVLKQLVRLMCNAIKKSMKSVDMSVPPWRQHMYVQAKWFGSYKRTIKDVSTQKVLGLNLDSSKKRSLGFSPTPERTYFCRDEFVSKNSGFGVGNLARVFFF